MPTEELERYTITFTEEAEAALSDRLVRLQRRLRSMAVEQAVRTRGPSGEVTASDVLKAYARLVEPQRLRQASFEDRLMTRNALLRPHDLVFEDEVQPSKEPRRKTYLERMGGVYIKVGLLVTAAGATFPILMKIRSTLFYASKETRGGLLVAAVGVLTAVFGSLLLSMGKSRAERQK